MPRLLGRLLKVLVVGLIVSGISSLLAALVAKRRLVSVGTPDDDDVKLVSILDSLEFRSRATAFRGGSLLAWYSGAQLDLRGATLDPEGADLDITTVMGGANVVVPDGWRVRLDGPAIFGANTAPAAAVAEALGPELRVRAFTLFGGTSVGARAWDRDEDEAPVTVGLWAAPGNPLEPAPATPLAAPADAAPAGRRRRRAAGGQAGAAGRDVAPGDAG